MRLCQLLENLIMSAWCSSPVRDCSVDLQLCIHLVSCLLSARVFSLVATSDLRLGPSCPYVCVCYMCCLHFLPACLQHVLFCLWSSWLCAFCPSPSATLLFNSALVLFVEHALRIAYPILFAKLCPSPCPGRRVCVLLLRLCAVPVRGCLQCLL